MCIFCDKIYENETELNNIVHNAWVNDTTIIDGAFVNVNNDEIALITVDSDNRHNHMLYDVKFCPYCGRKIEKINYKPCPICGNTEISMDFDADNDEGIPYHVIECANGHSVEGKELNQVIEEWNKGLAE